MSSDFIMPFGKYQGEELGDIPVSYLKWLVTDTSPKHGLKTALDEIEDEIWAVEDYHKDKTLNQLKRRAYR